jgi:hypothetical protein
MPSMPLTKSGRFDRRQHRRHVFELLSGEGEVLGLLLLLGRVDRTVVLLEPREHHRLLIVKTLVLVNLRLDLHHVVHLLQVVFVVPQPLD